MSNFNVHILSLKPEICSLIRKTLDKERYSISCTSGEEINEKFLNSFEMHIDCLILDKDINGNLSAKIKTKFSSIPIICLPSLGAEVKEAKDVKYMSEPFKLSELKKAVEEIASNVL